MDANSRLLHASSYGGGMHSAMPAMLCCIGPCTSRAQQNQACSWLGAQHATRHASSYTRRPSLSTLYCPTAQFGAVGRLQCVHPQGSMASVHPNHLSLGRWLQAAGCTNEQRRQTRPAVSRQV
jgi:hypothetical protein